MAVNTGTPGLLRDSLSLTDYMDMEDIEIDDLKFGAEQHCRLLGDEESGITDKPELEGVEWKLRPWVAIFGSTSAIILSVIGLIFFSSNFIKMPKHERFRVLDVSQRFHQRPESDYVLNPRWDFNAAPKIREYNWTIQNMVANPDGVFGPMLTINRQFPGPMIECNEGDMLIINVDNQGVNATTLHFHGIFQNGTNWMDGAPGVTQCPIAPRKKFQYKFTITGQSGTYFYHGHTGVQSSDGLFGPLVVHSKDGHKLQKIPYASDRVVMVQDYYHDMSSGLLTKNLSPGGEGSPLPDGALLNGRGQKDCTQTNRLCNNPTTSPYTAHLQRNANHRLRIVNVGVLSYFHISIDEHKMAITEADGTDLIPFYDTKLVISPAQRYSVIISTNQTNSSSFWLRAKMMLHCISIPEEAPQVFPSESASQVLGILTYHPQNTSNIISTKSNIQSHSIITPSIRQHPKQKHFNPPPLPPKSLDWPQTPLLECLDPPLHTLLPSLSHPAPPSAAHTYQLDLNIQMGAYLLERGTFNSTTFHPNLKIPTLHKTISALHAPNSTFPTTDGVNKITFPSHLVIQHFRPQVIDMIIQNLDESSHPLHLHGHKFWVLNSGGGQFPGYSSLGLLPEGKGTLPDKSDVLDNLLRRDVATLEGFGWLAIRFVVDNPGVWAFHCHMAWHSEKGLGMQFLSGVEEMRGWSVPEGNRGLCESRMEELQKGARPSDEVWMV